MIEGDTDRKKKTIAVWFSCGAASAVAAKITLMMYGDTHNVRVINNPIREEDVDNRRFLHDVEKWLGVTIESATNSKYPNCSIVEVFDEKSFMSGVKGAPCTRTLKKIARQQWESRNECDNLVLGFTSEEKARADRFVLTERDNLIHILGTLDLSKSDCFDILKDAGIREPAIYRRGYPNANCIGCVKATSPTYWNHVREKDPEVFQKRSVQSRRIGARLVRVKGDRIFLDELDPLVKGRPLKTMNVECGIFCEEY